MSERENPWRTGGLASMWVNRLVGQTGIAKRSWRQLGLSEPWRSPPGVAGLGFRLDDEQPGSYQFARIGTEKRVWSY
jgi:hypothetical protein